MNNRELMTIDQFNKLTGRETLHPLISIIDLSNANLNRDIRMTCDFYGLFVLCNVRRKSIFRKRQTPPHSSRRNGRNPIARTSFDQWLYGYYIPSRSII